MKATATGQLASSVWVRKTRNNRPMGQNWTDCPSLPPSYERYCPNLPFAASGTQAYNKVLPGNENSLASATLS